MSEESSMDGSEWHNEGDMGSWDSEDDLTSHLCRICAEASEDLIQCFGEKGKEIELLDKIHTHLPIMVTEDDLLPISVCTSCVKKLEVCQELVINCLEADARLRTILGFDALANEEEQYESYRNESPDPDSIDSSEKLEQLQDDELLEANVEKCKEEEGINIIEEKHESLAKSNQVQQADPKPEAKAGYKVILLKMKKSSTVSPDIQIEKALKFLKTGGKTYKVLNTNQKSLIFKNSEKNGVLNDELNSKNQSIQAAKNEMKQDNILIKEEDEEVKSLWNDTKYECIYCDETVTGKDEFVLHQSSVHNNEVYSCKNCELVYELKEDFLEHVQSHQEEKTKSVVTKRYPSPAELTASGKRKLSPDLGMKITKRIKISENGSLNENTNILEKGNSNMDDDQKFWKCKVWQCKYCGHMSTTKQGWREHVCESPQDSIEHFNMNEELTEHQLIHEKEEETEESSFNRQSNLMTHTRRHKADNGFFTCRICLKTFSNRGELLNHRKSHTREELLGVKLPPNLKQEQDEEEEEDYNIDDPEGSSTTTGSTLYRCPICYRSLPSQARLESHVAMHTDNSYPCHVCGKVLSKKNTLEYHLRTHTGEKPFTCSMCPGAFQSRVGLIVHERIHTGEKPYQCDQCDMAFRCRATLNQHKVVHSDERPFRCIHCGRGFRRRDTLDTHIRTHTDERPYACTICGRAFRQKGDCSKHEKIHEKHAESVVLLTEGDGSSVYNCPLCVQIFELKEDLDHHFENDHTPEEKASSIVFINSENVITIPGITAGEESQSIVIHELS